MCSAAESCRWAISSGAAPSIRRARSRVVTVAVNSFALRQPVSVGDVVGFYADVASVGKSSITVDVVVYAERRPADPVIVKVTEARLTHVAVDPSGRKRAGRRGRRRASVRRWWTNSRPPTGPLTFSALRGEGFRSERHHNSNISSSSTYPENAAASRLTFTVRSSIFRGLLRP